MPRPGKKEKPSSPDFQDFLSGEGSSPENRRICHLHRMSQRNASLPRRNTGSAGRNAAGLPVVLSRSEALRIFNHLEGSARLAAGIIYGSGLRLQECLKLRVRDIDFEQGSVTVRSGCDIKKRQTLLPESLRNDLKAHLFMIRALYEEDLRTGLKGVRLPAGMEKKEPEAGKEWGWFWLFPAQGLSPDPESKMLRRSHINSAEFETAFRRAAQTADTPKGTTVHTLRASFANHLIESGCAIQTVLELLGLSDTKTIPTDHTRILSVRSPLDSDRELRY